ncbi:AbrB/MazE/SpoVT family DNA-binding domain-containing protein [Patescibacteria group bacterium]
MYQTTITSKGQIVVPKYIREVLGVKAGNKLILNLEDNKVVLEAPKDIVDLAGFFKPKKIKDPLVLRRDFEKNYERI